MDCLFIHLKIFKCIVVQTAKDRYRETKTLLFKQNPMWPYRSACSADPFLIGAPMVSILGMFLSAHKANITEADFSIALHLRDNQYYHVSVLLGYWPAQVGTRTHSSRMHVHF